MTSPVGREVILAALRAAGRGVHLMELVQLLDLPKGEKDAVRAVLADLRALGLIKELPGNRFKFGGKKRAGDGPVVPSASGPKRTTARREVTGGRGRGGEEVAGWLTMSTRGYAFVSADDGGPDVFVPPPAVAPAMHGDRVLLLARPSQRGREGEVLRVLERGMQRVAGKLVRARRELLLETGDPRLPEVFRIHGALPLGTGPGDDVVAQVTRWPEEPGQVPEARVLSALGPRGSAETEIAKILIRENVVEELPEAVRQDALAFPAEVPEADKAGRVDLRALDLVTIDPEDARDHDDALYAERLDDGGYRVLVAIADVSHYVREGSPIDLEARARGCTIYMPARAIPMLPPELSTNLASLVPDEDRLTLAVEAEIGPGGKVRKHRFVEGVMRSRARLSYGAVARALGLVDEGPVDPEAEKRIDHLRVLHEVSRRLRTLRKRRGALGFDLPEAKVVLDKKGEPSDVVRARSHPGIREAYELVEDLMLLANELVAGELTRRKLPAIYRVHGKPDPTKVSTFAAVAAAFGYEVEEDAGESPKALQRVLTSFAGSPHEQALSYLLLRAMQQATYQVDNIGHFALAARDYLHFTSPIRRYPDLVVHRIVRALARGERIPRDEVARGKLVQASVAASRAERRAMTIEREIVALYRVLLMKDRVGEEVDGVISGLAEHGLYVATTSPWVEIRIPIATLGEDYYELDRLGTRIVARRSGHAFALGDGMRVRIESVALDRREIHGAPVSHQANDARPKKVGKNERRSERKPTRGARPSGGRQKKGGKSSGAQKKRGRGPRR